MSNGLFMKRTLALTLTLQGKNFLHVTHVCNAPQKRGEF